MDVWLVPNENMSIQYSRLQPILGSQVMYRRREKLRCRRFDVLLAHDVTRRLWFVAHPSCTPMTPVSS